MIIVYNVLCFVHYVYIVADGDNSGNVGEAVGDRVGSACILVGGVVGGRVRGGIGGRGVGFRIFGCLIGLIVVIVHLAVGQFVLFGLVALKFDIAALVELELVVFAEQELAAVELLLFVTNLTPSVLLILSDLPNYYTLLTLSSTNPKQPSQTYSLTWPHLPTPSTSPAHPSKNQPQH